jgi:putative chitinase
MMVTAEQLSLIMQCPLPRAQRWAPALSTAMVRFGITTKRRAAHFLAQVGHESLSLSKQEENLSYSSKRLLEVFGKRIAPSEVAAFVHQPEKLGNRVYASRNGNGNEASGDGYRYRGRCPIQLTGRGNYAHLGQLIGEPLEQQPQLLLDVDIGAAAAAAYWKDAGLNVLADGGDVLAVSRRINLGSASSRATPEGMADRISRTNRALRVLGAA